MDRRTLLELGSIGLFSGGLGSCSRTSTEPAHTVSAASQPEFSDAQLRDLLDQLANAYEARGEHVRNGLLPPKSRQQVVQECAWFPGQVPDEVFALYGWHAGAAPDSPDATSPFWFRDTIFCSPAQAQEEYRMMMSSYGVAPDVHDLLKYSFPISAFENGWYVLPSTPLPHTPQLRRPVIYVFQGITIMYLSVQAMLLTCIDWVHDPLYGSHQPQAETERWFAIWEKHNPGIRALRGPL